MASIIERHDRAAADRDAQVQSRPRVVAGGPGRLAARHPPGRPDHRPAGHVGHRHVQRHPAVRRHLGWPPPAPGRAAGAPTRGRSGLPELRPQAPVRPDRHRCGADRCAGAPDLLARARPGRDRNRVLRHGTGRRPGAARPAALQLRGQLAVRGRPAPAAHAAGRDGGRPCATARAAGAGVPRLRRPRGHRAAPARRARAGLVRLRRGRRRAVPADRAGLRLAGRALAGGDRARRVLGRCAHRQCDLRRGLPARPRCSTGRWPASGRASWTSPG